MNLCVFRPKIMQKEITRWPLHSSDLSELLDALRAGGDIDLIRSSVEMVLQALIDAEATEVIGAGPSRAHREPHEPTQRDSPEVVVDEGRRCGAGDPEAAPRELLPVDSRAAPPDRPGPVRGGDGGLRAWRVDPQGRRPGRRRSVAASGISKSEVSRICAELDESLEAFRDRPLDHVEFPYVFLDATYVKARVGGRIVSKAVIVATGVTRSGDREVLGVEVGDSEDGAFWIAFLRGLRARGLDRRAARDLRRAPRAARSDQRGDARRHLAALPGAPHPQRAGQGPEGLRGHGRRRDAHHLRPTRRRPRPRPVRRDRRHARPPVPRRRHDPRRRPRRRPRVQPRSPKRTGARSGPPTRSNASTARSNAAPASSASSPTTPPCCASSPPSSPKPTTNGKSAERRYLAEHTMALLYEPPAEPLDTKEVMPARIAS